MSKSDSETTLSDLRALVKKFVEERDWQKHQKPKNVAISIALEAAELLEHFQWDDTYENSDPQAIADELADILFNCLNFALIQDIDITAAFLDKLKRIEQKYPTEVFHEGVSNRDQYFKIKKAYRQNGK